MEDHLMRDHPSFKTTSPEALPLITPCKCPPHQGSFLELVFAEGFHCIMKKVPFPEQQVNRNEKQFKGVKENNVGRKHSEWIFKCKSRLVGFSQNCCCLLCVCLFIRCFRKDGLFRFAATGQLQAKFKLLQRTSRIKQGDRQGRGLNGPRLACT